jgi:AraC family transcriptional regulator of adaptative response/methylated-DNA-[protein]-cysteine methyltransferase
MLKSTSHRHHAEQAADVLIPLIRAAATIGFAIAPCSLGFVIIAVSEQFIRAIMVGEDPEMLVSDLQKQFPDAAIEAADQDEHLVAQVVDYIERAEQAPELPFNSVAGHDRRPLNVLQEMPAIP